MYGVETVAADRQMGTKVYVNDYGAIYDAISPTKQKNCVSLRAYVLTVGGIQCEFVLVVFITENYPQPIKKIGLTNMNVLCRTAFPQKVILQAPFLSLHDDNTLRIKASFKLYPKFRSSGIL